MIKLKLGDMVVAVFLGTSYECKVIEIIDKHKYKLQKLDGTILPNVTWKSLLEKKSPWYIIKFIKSNKDKVKHKENIQQSDLKKAIQKQKDFLGGNIEK